MRRSTPDPEDFHWTWIPILNFGTTKQSFLLQTAGWNVSRTIAVFGDSDMFFLPGESRVAAPETVYLLEDYLNALKYMPKDEIRRMCPNADLYLIDLWASVRLKS